MDILELVRSHEASPDVEALSLRLEFEAAVWSMCRAGHTNAEDNDPTYAAASDCVTTLTNKIARLEERSIEAIRAKATSAYWWRGMDGERALQAERKDESGSCLDMKTGADSLLATASTFCPHFKSQLDAYTASGDLTLLP